MPAVFRDWDIDDGNVEDHRHRHKKGMVEMTFTIIVRFIFQSVMLVPVVFTGLDIKFIENVRIYGIISF